MKPVLHYYNLSDNVCAFTTTRHGGYSRDNYSELNINPHRGDNPVAVEKNLGIVADELGISPDRIIRQHQVHGVEFRRITEATLKLTDDERTDFLEGVDSVGTDMHDVCIGVFTADCIPIIFYDARRNVIAAAHAGWRGTLQRIARTTIRHMAECFGSRPEDLQAVIGPGITLKNFEVGQEVYDQFAAAHFNMEAIARKYPTRNPNPNDPPEKWHIDLPECNRLQMIAEGVDDNNIFLSGIDTYDQHDDYFSSRRLHTGFGTMFTGIMMQ